MTEEQCESNRRKSFFAGFAEDLRNATKIINWFTPDGRRTAVKVIILGKVFEITFWYAQAYCAIRDDNYLMDYEIFVKEADPVKLPNGLYFDKYGFRTATYKNKMLTLDMVKRAFKLQKENNNG